MIRSAGALYVTLSLVVACASDVASDAPASARSPAAPAASDEPTGPDEGASSSDRHDGGAAAAPAPTDGSAASDATAPLTIFTIVLENQDYADLVGNAVDAPYIQSLIAAYGLATNYRDCGTHPSLPNYLTMISGAAQYPGFVDLDPTTTPFPVTQPNLGSQMQTAHIPWRSYQETMGTACKLTGTHGADGNYAPKHDPFLYFDDLQNGADGLCASTNVDYAQFADDLAGGAYRYMWITPNLTHDGHGPYAQPKVGLKASDAWLATELPKILASSVYLANGIVFLTWDEAEGRGSNDGDRIPMIVISKRVAPGARTDLPLSHASYLATVEDLLGLPRLATVADQQTLLPLLQ